MVKDKDNRYILVKPKDTTQLKSLKELNCTIAEKEQQDYEVLFRRLEAQNQFLEKKLKLTAMEAEREKSNLLREAARQKDNLLREGNVLLKERDELLRENNELLKDNEQFLQENINIQLELRELKQSLIDKEAIIAALNADETSEETTEAANLSFMSIGSEGLRN